MWVDNLPANLEMLALLHPGAVCVDNAPAMSVTVIRGVSVAEAAAKRSRRNNAPRSGSRGGRKSAAVSREDVLVALSGISELHQLFVFGFIGMLRDGSMLEFERLLHGEGCRVGNSATTVALDEYRKVVRCAWRDLVEPCDAEGKPRADIGTLRGLARGMGCSTAKAKRLLLVYLEVADLLMQMAVHVSDRLRNRLRYSWQMVA